MKLGPYFGHGSLNQCLFPHLSGARKMQRHYVALSAHLDYGPLIIYNT